MESLLEILKYTLPALLVFFTVLILLKSWSRNEERRRQQEFNMQLSDDILPVRMQAYERIILLLERISPDSMILRLGRPEYSANQLQKELLIAIKQEYDHNLSQQIYISSAGWEKVKTAKNQIIGLINTTMMELKPEASGTTLGKRILERLAELNDTPSQVAINFLKKEVRELFLN